MPAQRDSNTSESKMVLSASRCPNHIYIIAHGHTVRSVTALEVHQCAVEGSVDMQTAQLGCRHTALTQIGGRRCRPAARGHFRVQAAVLTIPREYSKVRQPSCSGAFRIMALLKAGQSVV